MVVTYNMILICNKTTISCKKTELSSLIFDDSASEAPGRHNVLAFGF